MRRCVSMSRSVPQGMVLVAVLWIVAALSLIVTGIVFSVRTEVRQSAASKDKAIGMALGVGAIQMVIQRLVAQPEIQTGRFKTVVNLQGHDIEVVAFSLTGLIDINGAAEQLLSSAYAVIGGLPSEDAAKLAQATVAQRERKDARGQVQRFEAVEDLLRVPGMTYDVYASLAESVTVEARGSGRVNPLAAPLPVLLVLASGNEALASRIFTSREAGQVAFDTTGLNPLYVDNVVSRRYLLRARVALPSGAGVGTTLWADLSSNRHDGLPWRTRHSESRLEAPNP
jgi:general secretion pathway protein K